MFATALFIGGAVGAGDADLVEFVEPTQRLPADNPEEQARAAVARGDYRFIWAHYLGGAAPVGVYCSLPLHMSGSLSLGKYYVSDVVPNENAEAERRQENFAQKYNNAIVEDPAYIYRDVCRPWTDQDRDTSIDERSCGSDLPAARLYENVRPNQMPMPDTVVSLQTATRLGLTDRVRQLATSGTDVDAQDPFGLSAIAWAAARGHEAIVRELLERGASVWPPRPSRDTETFTFSAYPIYVAAVKGHTAIVQRLVSALDRHPSRRSSDRDSQIVLDTSLCIAARRGDLTSVKALVEVGARGSVR